MKPGKVPALFLSLFLLHAPDIFATTPVKGSSEDLFWSRPMTVHSYKKKADLHNITVSAMALSELEFVRLTDDLIHLSLRTNARPVSKTLDSITFAYNELPQVRPVQRIGQLFDALQIRQISLSDAQMVGGFLDGDTMSGITSIMQVRIYKFVVLVEDLLNDVDSLVMFPVNRGLAAVRDKPVRVKSVGYVSDTVGILRQGISYGLQVVNKEIVKLGSNLIEGIEKTHDAVVRRHRAKRHADVFIYSKMPMPLYRENQRYFTGRNKTAYVGRIKDWHIIARQSQVWRDNVKEVTLQNSPEEPSANLSQEVIVAAEYSTWQKVPKKLKQYVITRDELMDILRRYDILCPAPS